jgi:hypothetical protein
MARKPQGIVDDIAKIGVKGAKQVIKGVRTSKKADKKVLKNNYPVSKKEVRQAVKHHTAKNASSLYAANPKKFKTSKDYFNAGELSAVQTVGRFAGNKNMRRKVRGDKVESIKRRGASSYKTQIRNAARNKKKSAIEINR